LGNALALVATFLFCANAWLLLASPADRITFSPTEAGAKGVVVVIIDGFRTDSATEEFAPTLARFARSQGVRTVRLETLLPSTVSGIRGLIEGTVHPPISFVNDFRASAAAHGGVIEAAHDQGMAVVTAGPHLWHDLYGRWIARSLNVFGLARDDGHVLHAALRGIGSSKKSLIIAHFSGPDVSAHQHGANSREYRDRVSWCDNAVRRLEEAAPQGMAIIVTGDHGLTLGGGHAGPEPDVLETLLLCNQPGLLAGVPDPVAQADVCKVIAAAAGIEARETQSDRHRPSSAGLIPLFVGSLGSLWAIRQFSRGPSLPENTAFALNVAVWISLATILLSPSLGGAFALVVLLYCAARCRSHGLDRAPQSKFVLIFAAGVALACLQISDTAISAHHDLAAPAPLIVIAILSASCFAAPILLRRRTVGSASQVDAKYFGALGVVTAIAAGRIAGETASLSTLDVRSAFYLLSNGFGLPLVALASAARPFLFPLLLVGGVVVGFGNHRCFAIHLISAVEGVTAMLTGQLIAAAVALPIFHLHGEISCAGYAFGLLIRVSAWVAVLFPVFALALWLHRRRTQRAQHCSSGFTSPRAPATVPPR
jgi:hypothetical protein